VTVRVGLDIPRLVGDFLDFCDYLVQTRVQPILLDTPIHPIRPGHEGHLPTVHHLLSHRIHRSGFDNTSTSRRVPIPRQRVPAPSDCDILFGRPERICAIQVGSVRGVLSSFLGRCYALPVSLGQAGTRDGAPCSLVRRAPPTHSSRG
jgi:hypothetical protein